MIKKQLSLLLCGILLLPLLLSSPAMAAEGMDVSVFQGQVDFSAARQGGVEIVYIRASYGRTGVDARFYQNCAAAQAAGIPFGHYPRGRPAGGGALCQPYPGPTLLLPPRFGL